MKRTANRLAILGGRPVRREPFPAFPTAGKRDLKKIEAVLASRMKIGGVLQTSRWNALDGQVHVEFERRFADFLGVKHVVACATGTAALEIALKALGVGCGDEVITTGYTCWATIEAILHVQAVPVFADTDLETYALDPAAVAEAITPRTKAIVVVYFGMMPDMDKMRKVARARRVPIVEDCCAAHGSSWRGKQVGTIGHIGAFSFGSGKLIQAGEGGAVVTNRSALAEACRSLRCLGRSRGGGESDRLGWNYRISEITAALLITQLEKFPRQFKRRQDNALYLADRLGRIPGLKPLSRDRRVTGFGYAWFIVRFDEKIFGIDRARFMAAVTAEGIPVGSGYVERPHHRMSVLASPELKRCPLGCPYYKGKVDYSNCRCPETDKACREAVWFSHLLLLGTRRDTDSIVRAVEKVADNVDVLRKWSGK